MYLIVSVLVKIQHGLLLVSFLLNYCKNHPAGFSPSLSPAALCPRADAHGSAGLFVLSAEAKFGFAVSGLCQRVTVHSLFCGESKTLFLKKSCLFLKNEPPGVSSSLF